MRRTLTTFLLLLVLFLCAFFITRCYDRKKMYVNTVPVTDVNKFLMDADYYKAVSDIEKYRLGVPRFDGNSYVDPSTINPTFPKPRPFINGYRQPINGLVPGDYISTLDPANVLFPSMDNPDCNDNCMDQSMFYDNILNDEAQPNSLFFD